MSLCTRCNGTDRANSKIPTEILDNCTKNRGGTCHACQQLTRIDAKVEDARQTLDRLLDEREALTTVLNEYHDPFVQRLPVEVVSRIFMHYRPFFPSVDVFERYDPSEHIQKILNLTHICQRWRNIAHGTPDLWTIIPGRLTNNSFLYIEAMLAEWIGRARGQLLFVAIQLQVDRSHMLSQMTHKFIDMIAHSAERWKVIELFLPSADCLWTSKYLSVKSLDVLESIGILSEDGQPLDDVMDFKAAPTHLTSDLSSSNISLDWANLTHFNAQQSDNCLSMGDCVRLFQNAPRLAWCRLAGVDPDGWVGTTLNPLHGAALQNLEIHSFSHHFWDLFTFPKLTVLQIIYAIDDGDWSRLRNFLVRSACQLLDLEIVENLVDEEEVVETLMLTPHLETLSIEGSVVTEQLFSLMDTAASSKGNPRIPSDFLSRLKSLKFCPHTPNERSLPVLLVNTMRNRPNTTLEMLTFSYITFFRDERHFSSVGKDELSCMLAATRGFNFKLLDPGGNSVLAKLCQHHKLEVPSNHSH